MIQLVLRVAVKLVVMRGIVYLVKLLFRKKNGKDRDGKDKP